jgi:non-specific serine/threonine protein kinase
LKSKHRLALSGTPIENNTMELWSLFDFLMPGYLGTPRWFNHQFASAIEREKDDARIDLLKKMIYPFILRRKKSEVETELPEKTEIVTKLRMEDEQLKLYVETAKYYREELEKEIAEKGINKSSIKILEGMLRLRQLCLFPRLMNEKFAPIPSAKFDHFTELMEDILAEDHKVLIFSQFVEVLRILREYFDEAGMDYSYLDGSTSLNERGETIKEFQENKNRRVFLLSLKAGGVALNLTAADYVVIFDPWWNPAVENQAIDRSHRIGQTKKVLVYRMVMEGSIEEKMLQLQEEKRSLVENLIISDAKTFKNLKKEDILDLFS